MYDRQTIMRAAWENYRRWHAVRESIHGPRAFDRVEFAWKLRCAWADAKRASMSETERRADAIRAEIDALKFKSFHINTEPTRVRLNAELAALAA
ncbi:MAG: hypothetical protein KL840_21905 [Aquamicrobium sp.]|nr:hypothetical protein [Aquamicrobium sp.]